jgi:SOS response regulatory protein OraA/RecX
MNTTARQLAIDLLSQRNVFSSELLNILRITEEKQGGRLTRKQVEIWI